MSFLHGHLLHLPHDSLPRPAENHRQSHPIPPFALLFCTADSFPTQTLRKVFWTVIVDGQNGLREETTFDFKYIPDLHKTTQMEDGEKSGIRQSGIERRNLQTLVLGMGFVSIAAVVGFRLVSGLVGQLVG